MSMKKKFILFSILSIAVIVLAACAAGEPGPVGATGPAGPAGPEGAAGPAAMASDLSCTECHTDSTLIVQKRQQYDLSVHNTGTAYARGTSASCAGCHSSEGFTGRMAVGGAPDTVEEAPLVSSKTNCRTCHEIHTSYTGSDWALTSTEPVAMYAFEEVTFDGGDGNLCASCHQPRRGYPEAVDGMVEVTSSHWGPHHGPQSAMLLGIAGSEEGSASGHYKMVEDTCVACHLGDSEDHDMGANLSTCLGCHEDAENFDINGVQTEVQALLDELEEGLIAKGWLDEEGHPTVASIPEEEAAALWNWIMIAHE
ncbi:MAG: hypothetical protein HON98_10970, partial [Chloroflexi bacterium]|nr:hypothetical protein [Chloroflexota bacterium]